jgi:hypothetical protein
MDHNMDHTTKEAVMHGERTHKAPAGECLSCDLERADNTDFHPSHDASERCQSGGYTHCTCDTCF